MQQSRPDFLFVDFNINPDRLVIRETTGSQGAGAYDAQLEVTSAFVKADFEPILFLRLALGGRYERGLQAVTPRSLFLGEAQPAQPPKRKEEYFLPAGTLTWNFFEDMQLRIGASKTIGRPQFRELAPQQYLDPDSDRRVHIRITYGCVGWIGHACAGRLRGRTRIGHRIEWAGREARRGGRRPRPAPPAGGSAGGVELRSDDVPVDDVPPGGEVVRTPVLVVEVVGVLPDVDAEHRRLTLHQR